MTEERSRIPKGTSPNYLTSRTNTHKQQHNNRSDDRNLENLIKEQLNCMQKMLVLVQSNDEYEDKPTHSNNNQLTNRNLNTNMKNTNQNFTTNYRFGRESSNSSFQNEDSFNASNNINSDDDGAILQENIYNK